jgi:hypothetical protein
LAGTTSPSLVFVTKRCEAREKAIAGGVVAMSKETWKTHPRLLARLRKQVNGCRDSKRLNNQSDHDTMIDDFVA